MKFKSKYLSGILILIVIIAIIVGKAISNNNIKVASKNEFNIEFAQCKTIINDTSTKLTDNQIKIIEDFENKNLYTSNNQFKNEFVPYLQNKMSEGLTSKNVNYIDKLVASSRAVFDFNKKIGDTRTKLIDKSDSLLSYADRNDTHETITPKEPTIGIRDSQVNISTWGNPLSKNITKSVNGTDEQWVYSNNRYIYIENGIVTAIQTH